MRCLPRRVIPTPSAKRLSLVSYHGQAWLSAAPAVRLCSAVLCVRRSSLRVNTVYTPRFLQNSTLSLNACLAPRAIFLPPRPWLKRCTLGRVTQYATATPCCSVLANSIGWQWLRPFHRLGPCPSPHPPPPPIQAALVQYQTISLPLHTSTRQLHRHVCDRHRRRPWL